MRRSSCRNVQQRIDWGVRSERNIDNAALVVQRQWASVTEGLWTSCFLPPRAPTGRWSSSSNQRATAMSCCSFIQPRRGHNWGIGILKSHCWHLADTATVSKKQQPPPPPPPPPGGLFRKKKEKRRKKCFSLKCVLTNESVSQRRSIFSCCSSAQVKIIISQREKEIFVYFLSIPASWVPIRCLPNIFHHWKTLQVSIFNVVHVEEGVKMTSFFPLGYFLDMTFWSLRQTSETCLVSIHLNENMWGGFWKTVHSARILVFGAKWVGQRGNRLPGAIITKETGLLSRDRRS